MRLGSSSRPISSYAAVLLTFGAFACGSRDSPPPPATTPSPVDSGAGDSADARDASAPDVSNDAGKDGSTASRDDGGADTERDADAYAHLRWTHALKSASVGLDVRTDVLSLEGDAVRLAASTSAHLPATLFVDANTARTLTLSGLAMTAAPLQIRRDASGKLAGLVELTSDASTQPAFAWWDDVGSATASTPLSTSLGGTIASVVFDAKGDVFAGIEGVSANAVVGYDITGAEIFRQSFAPSFAPRVAIADDGTIVTLAAPSDASSVCVTGWTANRTMRWSRDFGSSSPSYALATVGNHVVASGATANGAFRAMTLAAGDGSVIADLSLPATVQRVAPLASGAMYASMMNGFGPAQVAMLDAAGNERWRGSSSTGMTEIMRMATDGAGNLYVLQTTRDPATVHVDGIEIASFAP